MELIYNLLETILPFDFMQYTFMKNALIAIILSTPIFAILGTMIVNNKMAFFSDALGHSAFTGIAIGMLLGITNIRISMIFFAVIFALLLNFVKNKTNYGADTIISVFSSIAIALGLAMLSKSGNFNNYLVGDILSIGDTDIIYLFIVFIVVIAFWYFTFNKLNVLSINTTLAKSRGVNTKLIDNIFVVLIAVIVMISIRWIGILLINSLLILPAASSRNIAKNMRSYHLFSVIFSMFSGIAGLIISYYCEGLNIPTGPMIVLISGAIYFITLGLKKLIKE